MTRATAGMSNEQRPHRRKHHCLAFRTKTQQQRVRPPAATKTAMRRYKAMDRRGIYHTRYSIPGTRYVCIMCWGNDCEDAPEERRSVSPSLASRDQRTDSSVVSRPRGMGDANQLTRIGWVIVRGSENEITYFEAGVKKTFFTIINNQRLTVGAAGAADLFNLINSACYFFRFTRLRAH